MGIHIIGFSEKSVCMKGSFDPMDKEFFNVDSLSYLQAQNSLNQNDDLKKFALSKINPSNHRSFFSLLLLTSGDVSLNPGPTKYPCSICERGVRSKPIVKCGFTKNVRE